MNPMQFIYTSAPQRVRFGAGSVRHLNEELDQLGAKRALVLSTPQQRGVAEGIATTMGARAAGIYDQAVMHVPMESARAAQQIAKEMGDDKSPVFLNGVLDKLAPRLREAEVKAYKR